jgi:hypothetical protein
LKRGARFTSPRARQGFADYHFGWWKKINAGLLRYTHQVKHTFAYDELSLRAQEQRRRIQDHL